MNTALRPMRLGEVLDRTFQIYRARVLLFASIGALTASGTLVVVLVFRHAWPITGLLSRGLELSPRVAGYLASWFNAHFTMAFHAMLFPIYIACTSAVVFGGEASLRRGIGLVRARWRTYAWLGALKILLQMVVPEAVLVGFLAVVGLMADRMNSDGPLFNTMMWTFVGACCVFSLLVVFWLWPRLAFSFPACVSESLSARAAVRRSIRLARGRGWSIVLVWATVWMANSIVWATLRYACWQLVSVLFRGHRLEPIAQRLFLVSLYGTWWVFAALVAPIYPIAVTLLYYDQRIRKEGFDIEWLMQSTGMVSADAPAQSGDEPAVVVAGSGAGDGASVPVEDVGA